MDLIATNELKLGFSRALNSFLDYYYGYPYNEEEIDWIYTDEAQRYFKVFDSNVKVLFYEKSDSKHELESYLREFFYNIVMYYLMRFRILREQWVKEKGWDAAFNNELFIKLENGYISSLGWRKNEFLGHLAQRNINIRLDVSSDSFNILHEYFENVFVVDEDSTKDMAENVKENKKKTARNFIKARKAVTQLEDIVDEQCRSYKGKERIDNAELKRITNQIIQAWQRYAQKNNLGDTEKTLGRYLKDIGKEGTVRSFIGQRVRQNLIITN